MFASILSLDFTSKALEFQVRNKKKTDDISEIPHVPIDTARTFIEKN